MKTAVTATNGTIRGPFVLTAYTRWTSYSLVRTCSTWAAEATLSAEGGIVALSADTTRVLVGHPGPSNAVMFVRTGVGWVEAATLRGLQYRSFGFAVALRGFTPGNPLSNG